MKFVDCVPVSTTESDLAPISPMNVLIVEITSRCNLRCSYCFKAVPGNADMPGRDVDMSGTIAGVAHRLASRYAATSAILAGTGETTFAPGWEEAVVPFIDGGRRTVSMNTNLSRSLSDAEIATLSRFDSLMVSIDSPDRALQKELRGKSDIRELTYNLARLRAARSSQTIVVNCTVSNKNRHVMPGLVAYCSALAVDEVSFSDLIEIPEVVGSAGVFSVGRLDAAERAKISACLRDAELVGKTHGVRVTIQSALRGALAGSSEAECHLPWSDGQTRVCVQPWTRLNVAADGSFFPCCVTEQAPLGSVLADPDPANCEAIRDFRGRLLTGRPPSVCVRCTNAPPGRVEDLRTALAKQRLLARLWSYMPQRQLMLWRKKINAIRFRRFFSV